MTVIGSLADVLREVRDHPGQFYVYVMSRPCGEPFYVGCAISYKSDYHRRPRIAQHAFDAKWAKTPCRSHKLSVFHKIWRVGAEVGYSIVGWHDSAESMFAHEISLIAQLGRRDKHSGPLTNRTDGGEGTPNPSDDHIAAIKRASIGRKLSDHHRAMISDRRRGQIASSSTREKMSQSQLGRRHKPETIAKIRSHHVGAKRSPEARLRMSAANSGRPNPKTWRPVSVMGIAYISLTEAAKAHDTRPSTVFHWIRTSQKNAFYLAERRSVLKG